MPGVRAARPRLRKPLATAAAALVIAQVWGSGHSPLASQLTRPFQAVTGARRLTAAFGPPPLPLGPPRLVSDRAASSSSTIPPLLPILGRGAHARGAFLAFSSPIRQRPPLRHMMRMMQSDAGWKPRHTNRLIKEKSPYLLQHAHNPVDWYPWGEEAFQRARELDRPILLSSGYSTCHWCHVMERESFESERIARLLNERFVPIKVDREERPDVDAVYMAFIQAATGGGGWPMTVFLTPDRKPFSGGTYFPEPRFASILEKISDAWRENRGEVEAQGDRVVSTFQRALGGGAGGGLLTETEAEARVRSLAGEALRTAFKQLDQTYDEARGGFGRRLKFPRPSELNFLLRIHANPNAVAPATSSRTSSGRAASLDEGEEEENETPMDPTALGARALHMVLGTLAGMAKGGIRDWVGGGFHRYSTDPDWLLPHFEKMQYDNAQLLSVYSDAYKLTHDESFATVVHATARYMLNEMRDPAGGFYSAEDADSPSPTQGGVNREGAFYVWTHEEVMAALKEHGGCSDAEAQLFCTLFGVGPDGNVPPALDPHGEFPGQNVIHLTPGAQLHDLLPSSSSSSNTNAEWHDVAAKGLLALMRARDGRARPHRDEKVLACWTALAISGLAKAGMALQTPEYVEAAEGAAAFVRRVIHDEETGLLRRCVFKGELSSVQGLADDYAFLIRALLDLYEATAKPPYLEWAYRLQHTMDGLFLARPGQNEGRGYLSVSRDDSTIAYPVASTYDGAEPSATSVAVGNLLRLGALTDDACDTKGEDKEEKEEEDGLEVEDEGFAQRAGRLLALALAAPETPYEAPELLSALSLYGPGVMQVIVAGTKGAPDTEALASVVHARFLPNAVLIHHDPNAPPESEAILPEVARKCDLVGGKATAYVCQNRVCSLPITSPEALAERLDRPKGGGGVGGGGAGVDVASLLKGEGKSSG